MNKFDEAKELLKMDEVIKSASFEFKVGYSPMEDTLEPEEYAEYGFMRGQQEMLLLLIEKRVISVWDLYKVLER